MAGPVPVDWLTCDEDGCIGIRLDAGDKCLAHAADEERDAALEQVAQTGKIDARGVTISSTLLKRILDSTPGNPDGTAMLAKARFDAATFQGNAGFDGATFQGDATFDGAIFQGIAQFDGATFQGKAIFVRVTFEGIAQFGGATFQGDATFHWATFEGDAMFEATFQGIVGFGGATFEGDARFFRVTFEGVAVFSKATIQGVAGFLEATFRGIPQFDKTTFQDDAWFGGATFLGDAMFPRAKFQGNATFGGATFQGIAQFGGATFERAQQFGPLLAHRGLYLDGVRFAQPVQIEASTIQMRCRRARFPGGVQFRLRWAGVVLDDTDIPAPSLLTGISRLAHKQLALAEQQIARDWKQEHAGHVSEQPKLLSLRRANVAGLGLANVDLTDCRFSGAHDLDRLRLEADAAFKLSPTRVGWEQRQVVAEECTWRAGRPRSGQWADPWWPGDLEKPMALAPGTIADLYRALRKSREDARDEPGTADFYYGEMEMRRHTHGRADQGDSSSRGRVDRGMLTAYWLVSGYGLRAWRALAWLVGITVAFALAFHLIGFTHPPQPATYWTSLLYAIFPRRDVEDRVNLGRV